MTMKTKTWFALSLLLLAAAAGFWLWLLGGVLGVYAITPRWQAVARLESYDAGTASSAATSLAV